MSWVSNSKANKQSKSDSKQLPYQLNKRLNGHLHTNRNGKVIDVRKINRRYAENLFHWYIKEIKPSISVCKFKKTPLGAELYARKERG